VSSPFDLGITALQAEPGDHLCGLYADTTQRDQVLIPFLRAGLRNGDKCICVVDGLEPLDVSRALRDHDGAGDELQPWDDKQLDIIRSADMYLRSGDFSAPEVISTWKSAISEVMYDARYDLVRAIEVWSLRDVVPDTRELLVLESEMNRYLPLFPQVIICLYDVSRFGGGIVVDLLRTHPRVLVGTMVMENPYCLSPDELLELSDSGGPDAQEAEREEMAAWCFDATTGST